MIYASALNGVAGLDEDEMADDMSPLMDLILEKVSPPEVNDEGPLQMQISALDYNSYVGVIGIGRITRGKIKPNEQVVVVGSDDSDRKGKVLQVMGYNGLERVEVLEAQAGDIICVTGIDKLNLSLIHI